MQILLFCTGRYLFSYSSLNLCLSIAFKLYRSFISCTLSVCLVKLLNVLVLYKNIHELYEVSLKTLATWGFCVWYWKFFVLFICLLFFCITWSCVVCISVCCVCLSLPRSYTEYIVSFICILWWAWAQVMVCVSDELQWGFFFLGGGGGGNGVICECIQLQGSYTGRKWCYMWVYSIARFLYWKEMVLYVSVCNCKVLILEGNGVICECMQLQGSYGPYRCLQVLTNWICQVRSYKSLYLHHGPYKASWC